MEFSCIKENCTLKKNEFMELRGTDFDAWIERIPLEDVTKYFNYGVAVNEDNIASETSVDSSKENSSGGGESIGEKVMVSKSAETIHHHELGLKDRKGNDLRKGFR